VSKAITLPLPSSSITGDRILRLPQVKERTGMSRSFIYAAVGFPTPVRLGDRAVGWLESEISVWIESRKTMRQQAAA
jgi:prophage regulatory protein